MDNAWMRKAVLAVFLVGWCAIGGWPARAAADGKQVNIAVEGNNAFAFDLYGRLRVQHGGTTNLFFSPYSVSSALAMLYVGARGETAHEMRATLRIPLLPEETKMLPAAEWTGVADAYASLNKQLGGNWKEQGFALDVANALWAQKGEAYLPEYLDVVKKDFGGELTPVDFITQTEPVRQQINQWVANKTHDKITEMLSPGVVSSDTRLILTNAIYFKGAWSSRFDAKNTVKADFHAPGKLVRADMMHATLRIGYAADDLCQAVMIPYNGDQLAMLVILPKPAKVGDSGGKIDQEGAGTQRLEAALTSDYLAQLTSQMVARPVDVSLPKWQTSQALLLRDVLQSLGMKRPFVSGADFSGIDGRADLSISQVIHKAWVNIDESGTEAAGATAIITFRGDVPAPQPPVPFTANHPFLYLIVQQSTNTILFAGRLCDPTAAE